MTEDPDLRERFEAFPDDGRRAEARSKAPAVKAAAAVLAVSALWGTAFVLQSGDAEQGLATAEPDEFQSAGSGWEAMTLPAAAEPLPQADEPQATAAPAPSGPTEAELALTQTLADLRAEMDALREASLRQGDEEPEDDGDAAQVERLSEQIEELSRQAGEMREAMEAAEDLAEERRREILRLESELTLAQLPLGPPSPLGPSGLEVGPAAGTEAARLAALEERRARAEAERLARIGSPIVAYGGTGATTAEAAHGEVDAGEAFLRAGAEAAEVEQATLIANSDRTVVQGTVIQAVLETAIDSSLPGTIRAVVSEDVHSYDGSRVLIPRGSKLIGRTNADLDVAQSRLMVAWDRIITPDDQSVAISAYGSDELGRAGVTGVVDRRLGTRFGSAALVSLISALPSAAAAAVNDPIAAELAGDLSEDAEDTASAAMGDFLSLPPVIRIDQGARITVMVDRDLELF